MNAPIVHAGGTTQQVLVDMYSTAMDAVENALQVLRDMDINRRDYLIGGHYPDALAEHLERIKALERVKDELFDVCMDVADQGK